MPASEISKPHPVCPNHINCLETLIQTLSKAICSKNISVSASIQNSHCVIAANKQILDFEMSKIRKILSRIGIDVH